MAKIPDEELAEIEQALRDRLKRLDIKPKPRAADDFWSSVLIVGLIAVMALACIYLTYKGAIQ